MIEGSHGALNVTGFSGFETIVLANGGADSLTLSNANFAGVAGSSIAIDGGNNGNTVNAAGLGGANRIVAVGGAGKDVFTGGAGNDAFYFTQANLAATDIVKGGDGSDTLVVTTPGIVHAAGVSGVETYRLGNGGPDTLSLTNNNFIGVSGLSVSPSAVPTITVFDGKAGNTVIATGEPATDDLVVHAGAGIDRLIGGAGNDLLIAEQHTTMTGGDGNNVFALTASGPDNDTITDFGSRSATDDIKFADLPFGLTGTGALPPGLFTANSTGAFTASSQRFAYDTTNGELFYSAAGTTIGEHLILTLAGHPTLTATHLIHG